MKKLTLVLAVVAGVMLISVSIAAAASDVYGQATDPSYIGVGARPLGMGKAYVAIADDAGSIFVNPAGLGRIDRVLFSSMYSNFMSDLNYMEGSITCPVGPGTLAVGYLGVSSPAIDLYTDDGLGNPVSEGKADYNNYVGYLSYGSKLTAIDPDIMLGVNLKAFGEGFTGSDLTADGNGSGLNIDIGMLYQPNNWFTLGITRQNALDFGKMTFASGIKEDIPSLTKVGINMNLLGKFGLYKGNSKLNVAADLDIDSAGKSDNTLHLGVEYWPIELLALRAGLDQEPVAGAVQTNLTAGVGLRLGNVEFDYAYHTYNDIPDNATNYFSISFVGPFEQPKPRKDFVGYIDTPKDKNMMTYGNKVKVSGGIENSLEDDKVEVNGEEVALDSKGKFDTEAKVNGLGVTKISISMTDAKGKKVSFERSVLKVMSFKDVTGDFWARQPIELLATSGLITGYPDGTFKPERTLTRAELATLLVKAKNIPVLDELSGKFSDVQGDHWAAKYIEAACKAGLVKGYPDGTFKPDAKINKAEGVTVFARLEGLDDAAGELKDNADDSRFTDLGNSWAAGYVIAADNAGMLEYTGESDKFNPDGGFTRAEAAEILSKTTLGTERITALLAGRKLEAASGSNIDLATK